MHLSTIYTEPLLNSIVIHCKVNITRRKLIIYKPESLLLFLLLSINLRVRSNNPWHSRERSQSVTWSERRWYFVTSDIFYFSAQQGQTSSLKDIFLKMQLKHKQNLKSTYLYEVTSRERAGGTTLDWVSQSVTYFFECPF